MGASQSTDNQQQGSSPGEHPIPRVYWIKTASYVLLAYEYHS